MSLKPLTNSLRLNVKNTSLTEFDVCLALQTQHHARLPDDNRAVEPPDPFPNSEVKRSIADGSVGFPM